MLIIFIIFILISSNLLDTKLIVVNKLNIFWLFWKQQLIFENIDMGNYLKLHIMDLFKDVK